MNSVIHPELVSVGRIFKLTLQPHTLLFRIFLWAGKRNEKAEIDGFKNDTHFVSRSRGKGKVRVCVYT